MDPHSRTLSQAAAPAAVAKENWWAEVRSVLFKDLRSELRTKSALGTILMFAFTTMLLLSMLVDTGEFGYSPSGLQARARLGSALYWIVMFFSAMAGLPRVFAKEEEMKTAAALRLMARPSAVFTGKLLFNVALLVVLTLVLVPLFVVFLQPFVRNWPLLIVCFVAGATGLAGASTILGAIVARANNRGYLMVLLGFGPLLPILIFGIKGTTAALLGNGGNNLVPLVSYQVMMTLVSGLLFEKVWVD